MKKNNSFAFIIILFVSVGWLRAEKLAVLPGHKDPRGIAIGSGNLYVIELPNIYIYSLEDFKLKKKFGEEGDGPGQFRAPQPFDFSVRHDLQGGRLLVHSIGKVSLFDSTGKFIREMRGTSANRFNFLGGKFLAFQPLEQDGPGSYTALNIYDRELKKEKEIARMATWNQPGFSSFPEWFVFSNSPGSMCTADNKIFYCGGQRDFKIDGFDWSGKKLFCIEREYERLRFCKEDGEKVLQQLRNDPESDAYFDVIKRMVQFPDHFPAVRDLFADGQTLYVRTYKREGDKSEFFIFSGSGDFKKRVFLPLRLDTSKYAIPYLRDCYPFTFSRGKLYQLVKDEEKKEYELHVTTIE